MDGKGWSLVCQKVLITTKNSLDGIISCILEGRHSLAHPILLGLHYSLTITGHTKNVKHGLG